MLSPKTAAVVRRGVPALVIIAGLMAPALPSAQAAGSLADAGITAVTHTSVTVSAKSIGHGWRYRLYASRDRSDMFFSHLHSAPYHSALSSRPTLTVRNLPYSTRTYWLRVQATRDGYHHTGPILSTGLRPGTPSDLTGHGNLGTGTWLTWSGGSGTGYIVQRATDAGFSSGVATYETEGHGQQLTPPDLNPGTRYYFRVRAVNNGTTSRWSSAVDRVHVSSEQPVRVASYNILRTARDGDRVSDGRIAPWSQREAAAVSYIRGADPGVIAIQEGADWVHKCRRQVDALVHALGGTYALAHTEDAPCTGNRERTGVYIIYDTSLFSAVGAGANFKLPHSAHRPPRHAARQLFETRTTGARFLFVNPHLDVGRTHAMDVSRRAQTASMLSQARNFAANHGGVPIVYAGDFNSHQGRDLDGPGVVMQDRHVADGLFVSPVRSAARFNSANLYHRKPPALGVSIDHVYAEPGVSVSRWAEVLHLSHGRFVGVIPSDHNLLVASVQIPY